ncbi:Canalicular multispecific organic anion transporter 1 [Coemansia sp. S146]|nr:Canalicular multispecific organic anion transporter 1 [Coemansia sp. S146]
MRYQLQVPIYFAKLCAGPVADTAVACLAVLCLLTSKHSWHGIAYKRPVTAAASFANVALLLSTTAGSSDRFAASVAAALTLSMCSAASASHGNLQACLHIVRALNIAFAPSLLSLPISAASALIHLLVAWQLLSAGTKAHVICSLHEMFGIQGFALVMLGKQRPFTIDDLRDPAAEEDFCQKTTVTDLLLLEWRAMAYTMAIDTLIQLASNSRRLVFAALLVSVSRSDQELNILELGLLFAAWQLLVLMTPIRQYFSTTKRSFSKRRQALIDSKVLAVYAISRPETDDFWRIQSIVRGLVGESESFMSIISMTVAEIFNAWITASKIGWRALVPVVVALVHWLLSRLVTNRIERLREENRVYIAPKFQNDFASMLRNIRTIKFYAWEDAFSRGRSSIRFKEYEPPMVWRILQSSLNLLSHATAELSAALATTSFITTAEAISYLDIALLEYSIWSLTRFIRTVAGLNSKLTRFRAYKACVQEFLDADSANYIERSSTTGDSAVELDECVFSWSTNSYALAPITLQIKAGDFVAVVGRVGSGKSSFLSAICGEMPLKSGRGCVYGRIGYVEQKPWIMNATFRDNVLMGADFDEAYFWQVVEACALAADVRLFPSGDLTMIGTNGVNLSGGQKVRLALARALYLRADIYVLDDLLSAVDPHVERHIVERVLAADGIIGQKTRILVTHAEHLVPLSDTVITFVDGGMSVVRQIPLALSTASIDNLDSKESMPSSDSDTVNQDPGVADIYSKPLEYRKIDSMWLAIWRFIQLSGYGTVAIVMGIHIAQTYALYYTQSLRIRLMTDSDPATMVESLKYYLLVNAFVTIASCQIYNLEGWIQRTVLTTRLKYKMRKQICQLVLSMPLPLLESLPYSTMSHLYFRTGHMVSQAFSRHLCTYMVSSNLSAVSTIAQVIKTSPGLLVMCGPLAVLNYAIECWHKDTLPKLCDVSREAIDRPLERLRDALERNRPLLRVHDMTDIYLDKCCQLKSVELSLEFSEDAVRESRSLMTALFTEVIETAILALNLHLRLFASISVLPGKLDAETGLAIGLYHGIKGLLAQGGIDNDYIDQLSRYISYTEDTPREQPRVVTDSCPLPTWPETGDIEFRQYRLRYRPDLDPVLNDLSFAVRSKEKIGIVGRTGAGKSSLTYALMRLVEADSGSIVIDGVDISTIGLHDLRSRISIIPQDPSLFEGTIRDNLDPTRQYTDDEVWAAINACQIADLLDMPTKARKPEIKNPDKSDTTSKEEPDQPKKARRRHWILGTGLDKWVEQKGSNFSVGQQQLVSLCRALLWRRKILILDEATANVDTKTDQIMQSVIRQEFKDCTVLTIAHRINTILDSDRVLVMDQGKVVEFDTPANLLARDGHFRRLVESMNLSKK